MAADPSPLQRYLRVQVQHDTLQSRVLRDAANDAERLMTKLGKKYNFGSEVRRAQISLVLKELRTQQALLWGQMDDLLQSQLTYAADAAADAEEVLTDALFERLGPGPIPELQAAYRAQAQATVKAYQARTALGIPLSEQVYKSSALSTGLLEQRVNSAILLGKSAAEIASDVKDLIRPDVPGGVSYAAKRLGRTELNNAFHQVQKDLRARDPFVEALQWNLSGSHAHADQCDVYANDTHFTGGKAGQFKPTETPSKPHPQCLCYLTSVTVGQKEFNERFVRGEYNSYIDQKVYSQLPKADLPC